MRLRPLLLSLAILVPAAGAVWWLQRPAPAANSADARIGQRVADPSVVAEATRIRIESAGKTVELTRAADGRWTLAGTPALPADVSRLNRLAADLVAPKVERLVTSNASRLATLDLDASSVTLLDAAGKTLLALDLGKTADGGGRFVRYGDEAKAYLARLNVSLDAEPASWRDTALVAGLKAEDVASVSIAFPDTPAPVLVSRTAADATWTSPATPAGSQVKASVLSSQLGNLTGLRYTEVKPNLDPGVVAARILPRDITLTTFAGRTVKLALCRAPEPPAPPAPEVKEGETPPPPPPAAPRPVYVEVTDSQPDAVLAEAAKTHAFEIGEWIFTSLPAKSADLFEPVPAPPAAAAPAATPPSETTPAAAPSEAAPASETTAPVSVTTEPVSVTTEPVTAP
jgi:hypothetical protein